MSCKRRKIARRPEALAALAALGILGVAACSSGSSTQAVSDASTAPFADAIGSTGSDASGVASGGDASSSDGPGSFSDAGSTDASDAAPGGQRLVAFASGYGPNIVTLAVDPSTGKLSPLSSVAAFGSSPSFLAHNAAMTNLYAVDENATGRVGAYAIDPATGALSFLNAVSSGGNGPAFVSVDNTGKFVLVANYNDGTVSVLPVDASGRLGAASDSHALGAKAEAHMIATDATNAFVFVPCKGADFVAQFKFDAVNGKLTANTPAQVSTVAKAGPRHLAFHPNGRFAYLINETNSTMTAFALDSAKGTLSEIETKTTLPGGFTGMNAAAEVWVHPSGKWVLGSNRGDDSIVVFALEASTGKMTLQGFMKSGGATPRDFALDPAGRWLYAADQGANLVVPFRFDAVQGTLTPLGGTVSLTAATYVGLGVLP